MKGVTTLLLFAGFSVGAAAVFLSRKRPRSRQRRSSCAGSSSSYSGQEFALVPLTGKGEDDSFFSGQEERDCGDGHALYRHCKISESAQKARAQRFLSLMKQRRSVRFYSSEDVSMDVLRACIQTAGTSPSGAHLQPWHFVVVKSLAMKRQIRHIVEEEERINYERRMRKTWVADLEPLMNKLHQDGEVLKPYLEEAPALIIVMKLAYTLSPSGERQEVYYPSESCGIASGFLISALHNANLVTLTSTPMGAENKLRELLGRPSNEKVFLLMPVGYPAVDATVPFRPPSQTHKPLTEIMTVL